MKRLGSVLLGGAAALVVLRLWVMPLFSSLWLDEFGTVWVTGGGLREVAERADLFPQSLPYAGLVAVARPVLGSSEAALRLPSIVAMLAAVLLVGRLARACFGRMAAAASAGVFLLFPAIEFAAADARPYAFAVLFATAALLALRRFLESGRAGDAAAYAGAAAGSVYFQYLFAASLPAHVLYALWRRRRGTRATGAALMGTGVGLAALLAPAAIATAGIAGGRTVHAFGTLPGVFPLVNALVPVRVLALLLPAVGIAVLLGARGHRLPVGPGDARDAGVLLGAAALSPPIVLFAASWILRTNLFEGRYLLAAAAPWAVLLGGALAGLEPPLAARAAVAGALALALLLRGELARRSIAHGREDWRGALGTLAAVDPKAPVLLGGSFAEARDPALVADPRHQAYLTEPVRYYAPGRAVRALPLGQEEGKESLAAALAAPVLGAPRWALVERSSRYPSWAPWLDRTAAARGYAPAEIYRSGTLRVRVYERVGP